MNVQMHPRREAMKARATAEAIAGEHRAKLQSQRLEDAHQANRIEQYNREHAFYLSGGRHPTMEEIVAHTSEFNKGKEIN